jgi:predicted dehydrogenase
MTDQKIPFGTVGLGGYASGILEMLRQTSNNNSLLGKPSPITLVAATEVNHELHAEKIANLRNEGVHIYQKLEDFLAEPTKAIWIPLPIDLHRPFTEKALAAGKAVICEKPAAGSVQDVDAMIAARDKYKLPVIVGFQDVYDPSTLPAKRALLSGVIGGVIRASVHAVWPRNHTYYNRAPWAGKFQRNGAWVMDSPASNALAHYINILLFLLGREEGSSAEIRHVEAELYRVNDIENYDTISMRLTLQDGVTMLVNFTHAGEEITNPVIRVQGDRGELIRTTDHTVIVAGGDTEVMPRPPSTEGTRRILERFCQLYNGETNPDVAVASLEVARAHVVAVCGASEATPVITLPQDAWNTIEYAKAPLRVIPGIGAAFEECSRRHKLLHETGLYRWTQPAGRKDLRGYNHFNGPKK